MGIILAPFTAGQSLWLTAAGMAWSGVEAAQAGQLGAWAAGVAASLVTAGAFSAFAAPAMASVFAGAGNAVTAFQAGLITATEFGLAGAAGGFVGTVAAGGSLGQATQASGRDFGLGAVTGGIIGYSYAAGQQDVLHGWDARAYNASKSRVIVRTIPGPSGEPVPVVVDPSSGGATIGFPPSPGTSPPDLGQALLGNPARALRVMGRTFAETGHPTVGRMFGVAGAVLEPGGTGKIMGMTAGGTYGAALGRTFLSPLGPVGGILGSVAGGVAGGLFGSLFDSPYAGELE